MLDDARLVAVAPRIQDSAQLRQLVGRTDVLDGHAQELVLLIPVVMHGRFVHGDEAERVVVVNPHRQWIALEKRAVAMLALAQSLLGAASFGVDDADRIAAVVAHERRRGQHVDARAGGGAPGHVLFEHAEAVQKLAGGHVLLGRNDAANVLAEKRGIGIAEHRRCGAVGDANLSVEIDDDHASFHRRQNLAGRVLGRELDEVVAADGMRGDGDEGGRASFPFLRSTAPRATACEWPQPTCRRRSLPTTRCRPIRSGSNPT